MSGINTTVFRKSIPVILLILCLCIPGRMAVSSEPPAMMNLSGTREMDPDVTDDEIAELLIGNTEFTFYMYHQLAGSEKGNFLYSPYSISLALAMTYAGARGETENQMSQTLQFTLPQDLLHPAFNRLDLILASRSAPDEWDETEGFKLNIANSIWGQNGYNFKPEFLDILAENYGAGLRLTNFAKSPDEARVTINEWVEEQTEDRIKDLLAPGTVDVLTRMILVNAIYFNAAWAFPFEEDYTEDDFFYPLDGGPVEVPMMYQTERFRINIEAGYSAIQLPYERWELGMVIMMPDEGRFEEFEDSLDVEKVQDIIDGLSSWEVRLTMPKFTYESGFNLKDTLSAMGMPVAFEPYNADFSGMDGTRELYIFDVIHKAFIKVDEEGTEAAAATAVIMEMTSAEMDEPEPILLSIDRPFIYLIRDIRTGSILFVGRVMNPQ